MMSSTEHWFPGKGFGKLLAPSPSQRVPGAIRVFKALISPMAKRLYFLHFLTMVRVHVCVCVFSYNTVTKQNMLSWEFQ